MEPKILAQFRALLPAAAVITRPEELYTYECDGLTNFRVRPDAVFLPSSTPEVQSILRVCHEHHIPFVARGSGTGLSGGSLPVEGGVVIGMNRMNRILEVDLENGIMVVEPGVINLNVTAAAASRNYFYAPDPSSQQICSIGGNVAENAGGAHCLKYGFTTTHVRGLEVVLPDGSLVHLGGKAPDAPGLRSVRRFRWFGRHAGDRDQDYSAVGEAAGAGADSDLPRFTLRMTRAAR
jgi:glycolate oxidase